MRGARKPSRTLTKPARLTPSEAVVNLTRQKGVIRPMDLAEIGVPRTYLARLVERGTLAKVGRGLYALAAANGDGDVEADSLVTVAARVPQAVFCLLTALQFHELTTQLPRTVWIALPRGRHTPQITYPPLTMIQFSFASFSEGIESHKRGKQTIRVYGIAKTITDCFKHRNRIGLDVALEALKAAKARGVVDSSELWRFAKICRVANVMRPYLEALE